MMRVPLLRGRLGRRPLRRLARPVSGHGGARPGASRPPSGRRHGCNWRGAYSRRCGSRRSDWFGYCYTDHELQYSACESACGWPACHLILIDFAIREAGSGISAAGLFSGLVSCMSGKVVSFCLAQSKRKSMRALFLPETGMAKTGKNCYT